MMDKKIAILKVDPAFKTMFKRSCYRNGFEKMTDFSRYIVQQASQKDPDLVEILNKKKNNEKKREMFFNI